MIAQQDSFYPRLLGISAQIGARLTVLECGDAEQAERIVELVQKEKGKRSLIDGEGALKAEIWKCDEFGHEDADRSDYGCGGDDDDGGARAVAVYRTI